MNTYEQAPKTKAAMTAVTLAAIIGGVVLADQLKSHNTAANSTSGLGTSGSTSTGSSSTGTSSGSGATQTPSGSFKDGTYTASSSYFVPHGQESIQVTLTIKSGAVSAASIQNSESDPTSANFQESFAAEYHSQVVGKSLSGLQLGAVAGASDTTQGFNQALSQIAQQAQA